MVAGTGHSIDKVIYSLNGVNKIIVLLNLIN